MNLAKAYGHLVKKNMSNPHSALTLIKLAALLEHTKWSKFPDKNLPRSLQYLYEIMFKYTLEPLQNPKESAFVNLFAPCEILHAFHIYPLFIEAMATFFSGMYCEDIFIDAAENIGLSETLCSYHKTFIGAVEKEVLPKLQFAVTTTMICDANINTFKTISRKQNIPCYILDIPYEYSKDAEEYVKAQLMEMTQMIEDITHKKLNMDLLSQILHRENQTKEYIKNSLDHLSKKHFPNHMTLEMSKLMLTHCGIGRKESLNFFKMFNQEIEAAPDKKVPSILWVHTLPTYEETLKNFFNLSDRYNFIGIDLNYDYLEKMDADKPFNALAKKMLNNIYNGDFNKKIDALLDLIDKTEADGVINLCQWGCKQSSGGSNLLKKALKERDIPYLSIDGDGADKRNSPSGQIKTRIEAFLEILDSRRHEYDWLYM